MVRHREVADQALLVYRVRDGDLDRKRRPGFGADLLPDHLDRVGAAGGLYPRAGLRYVPGAVTAALRQGQQEVKGACPARFTERLPTELVATQTYE